MYFLLPHPLFKAKSETFVMNYQRAAILIVLLLRDPHGLESGQGRQD